MDSVRQSGSLFKVSGEAFDFCGNGASTAGSSAYDDAEQHSRRPRANHRGARRTPLLARA